MATYFPLLKTKQAEFSALDQLDDAVTGLHPVLEVIPRPTRKESLSRDQWYREVSLELRRQAGNRPVLVDPFLMMSRDPECTVAGFFAHLAALLAGSSTEHPVTPVVRLQAGQAELSAASALAALTEAGSAIRVTGSEIAEAGKDMVKNFGARLDAQVAGLEADRSEVDLLVDLGHVAEETVPQLYVNSLGHTLPGIETGWRRIIIAGTTGPSQNDVAGFTEAETPRLEIDIWNQLQSWTSINSTLHFGDYAGFAAVLPTGSGRTKHPSLRYSTETTAYLVRRKAEAGEGFSVYKDVCKHVVQQAWFAGPGFSWGDDQIAQTAAGFTTPSGGGATRWRAASVNHHMTLTAWQIANHPGL